MRSRFLIFLLPLALGGCGLPPAIAVASYAADGLLLISTGKSSTDHALSFAVGEDCAMWRVVKGEAICTELPSEGGSQVALEKTEDLSEAHAAADEGTSAPRNAETGAAPPGAITREALPPPGAVAEAPAASFPVAAADAPLPDAADADLAGTLRPADRAPVILLAVDAAQPPRVEPLAPVAAPRLAAVAATDQVPASRTVPAGRYYVLASYREQANAERHAAKLQRVAARIMTAEIDGIAHYRVIAGPYATGEGEPLRTRLAAAGITDHWPLDLCGGDCGGASRLASAN